MNEEDPTHFIGQLNEQRGREIDFSDLHAADREFLTRSPYVETPADVAPNIRKLLGPYFLVTMYDGHDPAIVIASSAYNTDLGIRDGRLVFPRVYGDDFWIAAIRNGQPQVMPVLPERAVQLVWEATGVATSEVPQLIGPGRMYFPQFARWRITLAEKVQVRGRESGQVYETSTLYVGVGINSDSSRVEFDQIAVALPSQPRADTVPVPDEAEPLIIGIREDIPLLFEAAELRR